MKQIENHIKKFKKTKFIKINTGSKLWFKLVFSKDVKC